MYSGIDWERLERTMRSPMDVSGFPDHNHVNCGLDWRGIENPCDRCSGSGYMVYGSTSTYWGGIGGAAMTKGVCNKCWGSGEKDRPWPSHKEFHTLKKKAEGYK